MIDGSLRSHSEPARRVLHAALDDAARSTERAFGTLVDVAVDPKVPVLVNDPACAARVRAAVRRQLGADRMIANPRPVMASEDFSLFLQHVPGAYFFLGQDGAYCHHPDYRFDTAIIPVGAAILVHLVLASAGQDSAG